MLTLPTVGYFVVKNNKVQHYLVQRISDKLSGYFGTKVSLSAASIDFFSNFHLKNFLVLDQKKDTLLYVPEMVINPGNFAYTAQIAEIEQVILHEPVIHLNIDSSSVVNLQFILNKLASKDTTNSGKSWQVSFNSIKFINGRFSLKNAYQSEKDYGINYSDMHLNSLNIDIAGLRTIKGGVEIKIKKFSAKERSGFIINHLSARMFINKENMVYNNVKIRTPFSSMDADQVRFNFKQWSFLGARYIFNEVRFNVAVNKSVISTNDLAYFVPFFKDFNLSLGFSGNLSGPLSDLRGRKIKLTYGQSTSIEGNFAITGLPAFKDAFLHVDISNFYSTPSEISQFYIPSLMKSKISLPSDFSRITWLKYKGKFTGFTSDFVAYGVISSNLGSIQSDISIKPDSSQSFSFSGQVKTTNFQIGKYLGKENIIGDIALNAYAKGVILKNQQFNIDINGKINSFVVNRYNYQNVDVNGAVTDKSFTGNLSIKDPNADLDFSGNIDFTSKEPAFNFIANARQLNLKNLNINILDSISKASFYATADFKGNDIDNISGEIKLWNSTFEKSGKLIHINDFLLFTQMVNDTNRLVLRSSIADAEVWGTYKFKELIASMKGLMKPYFPSLIKGTVPDSAIHNNFKFDIDFKDSRQLADFVVPGFYISKDSKLTGLFNAKNRKFNFLFKIPLLQHNSKKWYNVYLNGVANKDSLSIISGCNNLKLTKELNFENFTILSTFKNDSVGLTFRWNNWDTILYKGNISVNGKFRRNSSNSYPRFEFNISPSEVILKDSLWNLFAKGIVIDSSGIIVKQLELHHQQQSILASGKLSRQKDDNLLIDVKNFSLNSLTSVYAPQSLLFGGVVNGRAQFSDIFTNPYLFAALKIDSLTVNNQNIGYTEINANWEKQKKSMALEINSFKDNTRVIQANGNLDINKKDLDFDIKFENLKIAVFEPFMSSIFSNIKGSASGFLKLKGPFSEPVLNGEAKTSGTDFTVKYLQTKYSFASTIPIVDNTFIFKNITAYDSYKNKAVVNGSIELNKFRDVILDLTIDAKNLECLNTSLKDNSLFYGKAYGTGKVAIKGKSPIIEMDISATSNAGTVIYIPLLQKTDIQESSFVTIVQKDKKEDAFAKYEIDKNVKLSDVNQVNSQLKLDLNFNVTPDANIQIVFDQKIGSYIQGTGNGNFRMELENNIFSMYGIYTIEKGIYSFVLPNFNYVNKKFEVEQGSTLTFSGNPMDANVNLDARYSTKASLYDLLKTGVTETDEQYRKRVNVDCKLAIKDKLMNPSISWDIYLPDCEPEIRNKVDNVINNEEEKSIQFLSLLVLNSFMQPESSSQNESRFSNIGAASAGVTGLEFLSNQLSLMLSQINDNVDFGINYHPGDEITKQELELALSTRILNDRVILNGNVDVGVNNDQTQTTTSSSSSQTNNVVGDFSMEYKLKQNGKVRLKAFNRSNESYLDKTLSPYTQGVGIFYHEDFNTFDELFKKYYRLLFTRKKKRDATLQNPDKEDKKEDNKLMPSDSLKSGEDS